MTFVDGRSPPLGHIRLFRKEILESGLINMKFVDRECAFLDATFVEKLRELFKEDPGCAVKHLFHKIAQCYPEETRVFLVVLQDACREESEVLNELYLTHLKKASRGKYLGLVEGTARCTADIMSLVLKAEPFVETLQKKYPVTYDDLVKKVRALLQNGYHDAAACKILRSMPLTASSEEDLLWWFHLLDVCDGDPSNRVLLKMLDSDFRRTIDEFRDDQKAKTIPSRGGKAPEVFDASIEDRERQFRPQESFLDERELVDVSSLRDAEEIILRDYQKELIEGVSGGNTIICAPTGSGKTIVATKLILDHLAQRTIPEGDREARVVMFVPTIPLVEQQSMYLLRFMRKKYYVLGASGAERILSLGRKILAADVVVITPELFYNFLTDPREAERIFVSDFSLLVFDECHHCTSSHPYRKITRIVMDFKGRRPQMVGLTASVGVGNRGTSPDECIEHMVTICANMSATSITTVRRCVDSLNAAVSAPEDRIIPVARSDSEIRRKVVDLVRHFEGHAKKRLGKAQFFGRREKTSTFPDISKIAAYFGFLNHLTTRVTIDNSQNISEKNAFLETIKRVKMFYTVLNLVDLLPAKYALSAKNNYEFKNADGLNEEQDKGLCELEEMTRNHALAEEDLQKDILRCLHEVLRKQYKAKPDSRTLIFVNTRDLAALLRAHLNDHWDSLQLSRGRYTEPVGYITSSNKATSAGGLNAQLQRKALDNFRSGKHRVLVATSVADEGLDVATCNLIVKYNSTGSELTLIQRRGRARAKDSSSVLLALDGAIEKTEYESKVREMMMHATLAHLYALPEIAVRSMIEEKTEELRDKDEKERQKHTAEHNDSPPNPSVVVCIKCSQRLTSSASLRRAGKNQVAACDPEIWGRLRIVANEKVTREGGQQSLEVARVICGNGDCGNEVASLGSDGNVFLPFLRASAVTLYEEREFENEKREERKALGRWRALSFFVRDVDDNDRKEMCIAFEGFDAEKTKEVRRTEERRQQRRAKAAVADSRERELVRRIFQRTRDDPNAEDDDYGYSTSASQRITQEDIPLQPNSEYGSDEDEPSSAAFYGDIVDSEDDLEGYEDVY